MTTNFPTEKLESSELPTPYSESDREHYNSKYRTVYCKLCKYTVITDLPGPRCGLCHSYLITVVNDELVR